MKNDWFTRWIGTHLFVLSFSALFFADKSDDAIFALVCAIFVFPVAIRAWVLPLGHPW